MPGLHVGQKVGDGLGGFFLVEFQNDVAHAGFKLYHDKFFLSVEM
jgi:hypothetical protein